MIPFPLPFSCISIFSFASHFMFYPDKDSSLFFSWFALTSTNLYPSTFRHVRILRVRNRPTPPKRGFLSSVFFQFYFIFLQKMIISIFFCKPSLLVFMLFSIVLSPLLIANSSFFSPKHPPPLNALFFTQFLVNSTYLILDLFLRDVLYAFPPFSPGGILPKL